MELTKNILLIDDRVEVDGGFHHRAEVCQLFCITDISGPSVCPSEPRMRPFFSTHHLLTYGVISR